MVNSHHSHSGQYVSHAVDTLEDVVAKVIEMNFQTYCLTEHIPRYSESLLYPEEVEKNYTTENLVQNFEAFYKHALRVQKRVNNDRSSRLRLLVGFEMEGGIDDFHLEKSCEFKKTLNPDVVVGSVHHMKSIPLDFDRDAWLKAKGSLTFKDYYLAYFEQQQQMIKQLKPEVVGHFDLIRLFERPDEDVCEVTGKKLSDIVIASDWPDVWSVINGSIDLILEQGGLVELNSAAIRKGWNTPYPKRDIVELILSKNGKLCLSDDSHGTKQVGLNYHKVLEYLKSFDNFKTLYFWDLDGEGHKFVNEISLQDLVNDPFWKNYEL